MNQKVYNFDVIVNRYNTNSLKYDFTKKNGKPKDIVPLWVADMDFPIADEIIDGIKKQVEHGIYGYSEPFDDYYDVLSNWMKVQHDWIVRREWIIKTPGVVFAIAMAIKAFSEVGDSILIQQPVYYPFSQVIQDNERNLVINTLILGKDNKYHIDFNDFKEKIVENQVKLFILCNPQNPIGRVWTKEELTMLGNICLEHNVIVISDEIHEDFVYEGKHQVFANINRNFQEIAITCTAPSKTFNMPGLQVSNIFIANNQLREAFRKQVNAIGYSQLNIMGIVGCKIAYEKGGEWHKQVLAYLKRNLEFATEFMKQRIPSLSIIRPEGTYLLWIDFRGLELSKEERQDLIVNKAKLWLDRGDMFGKSGEGFERINIACPRAILSGALEQLAIAINNLENKK